MNQIQKSISLDQKLWEEIDKKKGDVSRSRFLATIVAKALDASENEQRRFKKVQDSAEEERH